MSIQSNHKATDTLKEADGNQTGKQVIARAAAILRCLEQKPEGLNLSQIARLANLPRSTVQRLVTALETQQLVAMTPQGVKLGPALARLAASAHMDIIALSRPHMEILGRSLRETVDLSVERGEHAISVDQYASDQELRVVSAVGAAFPLHATAHGKALLSRWTDNDIRKAYQASMEFRTKKTLSHVDELLREIETVRVTGFAHDLEEHADGVCGIGVWLETPTIERYAISIGIPAVRYVKLRDQAQHALARCKAGIEASIGQS
ncbi:IclR family transcriptional regulator [Bartonella sp. LJL80]